MALLLNIDTATEHAGVCLSNNNGVLAILQTIEQKNHASFIQPAIKQVMAKSGYNLADVDAIAVSAGPGSYTGLRVGLATAKGLCYALNKPLLMINTLEIMALSCIRQEQQTAPGVIFCPMIDARRMEVFTALYDASLNVIMPPAAIILNENSFNQQLQNHTIIFSGSGSKKAQVINSPNAFFSEKPYLVGEMAFLSGKAYNISNFANLAYSEPFYLKEFYKPMKKN
jgi:tRNA threonylcarbamoyladenosine biosynthesis protein TsaB